MLWLQRYVKAAQLHIFHGSCEINSLKLPINSLIDIRYGAKRIRTADPFNAIEVRYQLRYSPLHFASIIMP